jgi:hypothetical protein
MVFRVGGALLLTAMTIPAAANSDGYSFKYYGEWMTSWSGCCTSQPGLSQTGDQINEFAGVMDGHGHSRVAVYGNQGVWAADTVEDGLGGADNVEADQADIYAYSGHGAAPNDSNGQTFQSPRCLAGYSYNTCWFDSANARTNEVYGTWATNPGHTRWIVLLTCYSVHTDPWNQWIEAFGDSGTEYIVGYRGTSADSFTTDEVAGDYANNSYVNQSTFKSGWFSATSDWWVDDTAEVVSGAATQSQAIYNRDNYKHTWPRRINSSAWNWLYWAWQEG